MDINKDNFKQITENMRKVLVYMASRKDPFGWEYISHMADEIGLDNEYTKSLVHDLLDAGLLKAKDINSVTPSLSHKGLELAQDLSNDERFKHAVELCEKQEVYSLSAVAMTVRQLASKSIIEEINR